MRIDYALVHIKSRSRASITASVRLDATVESNSNAMSTELVVTSVCNIPSAMAVSVSAEVVAWLRYVRASTTSVARSIVT